jgi:RND family efflux transporter MFP subunit
MPISPNRKRVLVPVAIVLLAVLLMAALASMRSKPPQRAPAPRVPVVEVVAAQPAAAGFELRAQGTLQPRTQTTLVSEVGGTVLTVAAGFEAGGFFKRGDVLLTIDPKDYEVAVLRAEANLASRQALLQQETARAEQAAKDWASLGRSGPPNDLVLRKPDVAEAEANVRAAEADLAAARVNLQRTRVRAPFDGLLLEKRADIGQYMNVGGALGVLAATDRAEVRLPLTEADLAVVALPDDGPVAVRLLPRDGGRVALVARLVRTEGVLDARSRVMHAVVQVDDPYRLDADDDNVLAFGSFVEVRLPARLERPLVAVPRHALRGMDELLLVDDDGRLRRRQVEVLRSDPQSVYVASGLAAGERVIVTVIEAPVDGMAVRIADDPDRSAADLAEPGTDATLEPTDEPTAEPAARP